MVPCFFLSWSEVVEQHIPTQDSRPTGHGHLSTSLGEQSHEAASPLFFWSTPSVSFSSVVTMGSFPQLHSLGVC